MNNLKAFAYYFPHWHEDARDAQWFGEGFTEWDVLAAATPRFPGHRQPRVPLWGYYDEADPENAAREIQVARAHGLAGFIFDFYWYDDGPYLNRALDEGFLKATNSSDLEFAIMWANHDLTNIFPATDPVTQTILKEGGIDRTAFDALVEELVVRYFSQPNYLKVDGRPWFSIYEIGTFIRGLGGVAAAEDALRHLDERAREAGFPGVHVDIVVWEFSVLRKGTAATNPNELIDALSILSASSYVWIHHADLGTEFPVGAWDTVRDATFAEYEGYVRDLPVQFIPNVSVGWDSSPRTDPRVEFANHGYPWTPVFDAPPSEFERGLRLAIDLVRAQGYSHPMITINAWNEWTEGAALAPDVTNGFALLEILERVLSESAVATELDPMDAAVSGL
jgi:Glycosyltransferase WbsX